MSDAGGHAYSKILLNAFRVVRDFYRVHPPKYLRDGVLDIENGLIPKVELYTGRGSPYKIGVHQKTWDPMPGGERRVYGWHSKHQQGAEVYYWSGLNFCWSRLVVAKEIAHVLFDKEPEHTTTDAVALVQSLITGIKSVHVRGPIQAEHFAQIVALELLVPWSKRHDLYRMEAEGKKSREIAEWFKVPEAYIDARLGNDYREACDTCNDLIGRQYKDSGVEGDCDDEEL